MRQSVHELESALGALDGALAAAKVEHTLVGARRSYARLASARASLRSHATTLGAMGRLSADYYDERLVSPSELTAHAQTAHAQHRALVGPPARALARELAAVLHADDTSRLAKGGGACAKWGARTTCSAGLFLGGGSAAAAAERIDALIAQLQDADRRARAAHLAPASTFAL